MPRTFEIPNPRIYDILDLKRPLHPLTLSTPSKETATPKDKSRDKLKKATIASFPNLQFFPIQSAAIPFPPKWSKRKEETVKLGKPFKLFSVGPKTSEYATITELLHPYPISDVDMIVNPILWSRFENYRKDMFSTVVESPFL